MFIFIQFSLSLFVNRSVSQLEATHNKLVALLPHPSLFTSLELCLRAQHDKGRARTQFIRVKETKGSNKSSSSLSLIKGIKYYIILPLQPLLLNFPIILFQFSL